MSILKNTAYRLNCSLSVLQTAQQCAGRNILANNILFVQMFVFLLNYAGIAVWAYNQCPFLRN